MRSDRLTHLVEILQDGRLHLARDLADRLEVSVRTIYRDMDRLIATGVPIEGARGVGYMLREPVFLPPLALSLTELEALHLGMALVSDITDPELSRAARTLSAKISRVSRSEAGMDRDWGFGIYPISVDGMRDRPEFRHMSRLRHAIRDREKVEIGYGSLQGASTQRVVRPLQLDFWGKVWTLCAWCELRADFRSFRVDLITTCQPIGTRFKEEPGKSLADFLAKMAQEDCDKQR
jgi:predicted DNA-binding transcriptional regulator YafY